MTPFVFAVPLMLHGIRAFRSHYVDRGALPFPSFSSILERPTRSTPPPTTAGIPVLVYHGISGAHDYYSISQVHFARQMEMLHRLGYSAVSVAQYDAFLHGQDANLPTRPILITFDDGRLDSYRGADAVLRRLGFRASIFVISGSIRVPFYLTWAELRRMAASQTWDVAFHAGKGHVEIPLRGYPPSGPFYAFERELGGGQESYADWKTRVIGDLTWGIKQLHENVPAADLRVMAVPYGNYGQNGTNDPRIPRTLGAWLHAHFDAVFVQTYENPPFTAPGAHFDKQRLQVHATTTTAAIESWLRARANGGPFEVGDVLYGQGG